MEIISEIPVVLSYRAIVARLRYEESLSSTPPLEGIIAAARPLIHPRALFAVAYTEAKGEKTVEIDGVVFESGVLRRQLGPINKVFPYIITVGPELERFAASQGDLLKQYYLEEIANIALEEAAGWLAEHLRARFGLGPLSNLSPGSLEDWPITEQPKLFSILGDTERLIGVRLT
ncbi:MAG: hypothetical protein ABIN58_12285, partial [candidate division WOR-3 bacterium]